MLNDLLPDDEQDEAADHRAAIGWMWPLVHAHDGQPEAREWSYADMLYRIARTTLERHYSLAEADSPAQQQVVDALQDLSQHAHRTRNDGLFHPYVPGDWFKLQACLGRVLPLVGSLLAH